MRRYKIYHTDAFTDQLFGGNPTVTVLSADSLSDLEMKKIAREMNLSETGFVLNSKRRADFRLRFFTPAGNEIKFCGHATVGALYAYYAEGLCTKSKEKLRVETNAGILEMEINGSDPMAPRFILDSPEIKLVPAEYTLDQVVSALGIQRELIDFSKPLLLEKTNNYLYFTARNLDSLGKIVINTESATKFASKDKIVIFCILTPEAFDPDNQLHARGFAPWVGVPEDPFTGSMQGGLVAYAMDQGMLESREWICAEQGHFMGRPGSVKLELINKNPVHVRLHASAVFVFNSEIQLP